MSDKELCAILAQCLPVLESFLREGINKAYQHLLELGVDDTAAWRFAHFVAQREIFQDHMIMTCVAEIEGREKGEAFGAGEDFIDWVKREYAAWDHEAA
jgi:hypothetical protein